MKIINMTDWRPDAEIQNAIEDASKKAVEVLKEDMSDPHPEYPTAGLGITTLRPAHLATPEANSRHIWMITIAAAYTWQNWFSITMQKHTFIVSCGIFIRTTNPGLTELAFRAGGNDLPIQNFELIYVFPEPRAWWSKPFWVKADSPFVGRLYGEIAQVERLGMSGFAIAKKVVLITETEST